MKKYIDIIIGIVGIGVIILALILFNPSQKAEDAPIPLNPNIITSESEFNFGNLLISGGLARHKFSLKNSSQEKVVFSQIYTSCMCTKAFVFTTGGRIGPFGMPGHGFIPTGVQGFTAEPGSVTEVEVVFDPAAHGPAGVGPFDRLVYLRTNSGEEVVLKISGTVTP